MDVTGYKERLIELEAGLSSQMRRYVASGREQLLDTAADAGDASIADESESVDFTEAELDTTPCNRCKLPCDESRMEPMDNAWLMEDRSIRNDSTPCRRRHIAQKARQPLVFRP